MSYNREKLVEIAIDAAKKSYSPYSNFCVGAALLCADGEIFEGTNVENVSYGATNCAERTAFFEAVMEGKRDFVAIAIVGSKRGEKITSYCAPCGICRQVMAEFCGPEFEILLYDGKSIAVRTLGEVLPDAFDKANL